MCSAVSYLIYISESLALSLVKQHFKIVVLLFPLNITINL